MIKERVTVDFDEESYYLDGEYWESWDNYGEEMADSINKLLNNQDMQIFMLKCVIQTITAESMDKNISHKRIMEIKKHWYDKLYGDSDD